MLASATDQLPFPSTPMPLSKLPAWSPASQPVLVRVPVALLAAAAAVLVRIALDPLVGSGNVPYITLFITLGFLGWYAGIWPSIAALVSGGIGVQYFILDPVASFDLSAHAAWGLLVYFVAGTLCVLLGRTLGHLRETAEEHLRREQTLQVQLAEKARELEEADRRKDEFLATLAHELRNPLGVLRTGLASLGMVREGSTEFHETRDRMERQLVHIVRLVDDLLDLGRIAQGTIMLQKEPVAVSALLQHAVEACRPNIDAKRHQLIVESTDASSTDVIGDFTRLTQVLTNLLTNACKFTPPGGHIAVRARFEGGEVMIAVSDDGPGIPAEIQSRVFDLFVQGHDHKHGANGGLGIGLHVAMRLVTLHGGTLTVTSNAEGNSGSTFTVRLPATIHVPERENN